MNPKTLEQIAQLTAGTLHGNGAASVTRIVTDSRSIQPGDFFIALRGERFDGHAFLAEVQERGAAGALVSQRDLNAQGLVQIEVSDTLEALQRLAKIYRTQIKLTSVGITGSNGKTSTKEMLASVLGERFSVTKTVGNYNNHIGLPLTVLGADDSDQMGVFELGMNHPGELAPLVEIARPDFGIITNIGIAHIGHLGSRAAIAQEKAVLAERIPEDGCVILNANDDFTDWIASRCRARVIRAGIGKGDLQVVDIQHRREGEHFSLACGSTKIQAKLPTYGEHMVINASLAAAAGLALGLTLEECALGLAKTAIPGNRLKIHQLGPVLVINDAYNANPESMLAALKTAVNFPVSGRRVAALGRMGELGDEAEAGHRRVGRAVAELDFDLLVTVGEEAELIAEAAHAAGLKTARQMKTHEQAVETLLEYLEAGDLLLVKGSFTSAMDRVVQGLEAAKEKASWRLR